MRNRRGVSLSLFFILETLLAVVVIFTLSTLILNMVQNANFFERYYAKDNALLLEVMHGVPNGELKVGYLWLNPSFVLSVQEQSVTVVRSRQRVENRQQLTGVTKYFGKNLDIVLDQTTFSPQYYQYIRQPKFITVTPVTYAGACAPSGTLSGVSLSAIPDPSITTGSISQDAADRYAADISSAIALALPGKTSGTTITIVLSNSPVQEFTVYRRSSDQQAEQLGCLLGTAGVATSASVAALPITTAPAHIQRVPGDLVLSVGGDDMFREQVKDSIREAVINFEKKPAGATP